MSNHLNIDFKQLAQELLSRADSLLPLWLPDGTINGAEFMATNPTRLDKKKGSFSVNRQTGAWADFATDDKGGDLLSLYCYLNQCPNMREAAEKILEKYGNSLAGVSLSQSAYVPLPPIEIEWETVMPVPADAVRLMLPENHYRNNEQREMVSVYRSATGEVLGAVVRFRKSDGSKADIPRTFRHNLKTGAKEWAWKTWTGTRPLYGLDVLAQKPDAPVLVVEGEKCKNVAEQSGLFDDWAVVSWSGGCHNWSKADWSVIQNRKICLWADADCLREKLSRQEQQDGRDPESKPFLPQNQQNGMAAMAGIGALLQKQGCIVHCVALPDVGVLPSGYDIADAIEDNGLYLKPREAVESAPLFVVSPPTPTEANSGLLEQPHGNGGEGGNEDNFAQNLQELKRYFALIEGKMRMINIKTSVEYGKSALIAQFCKESVETWLSDPSKRLKTQIEVNALKKDRQHFEKLQDKEVLENLQRYIYLDGSTSIWDIKLNRMIDQGSAKLAMGKTFEDWRDNPQRRVVRFENVVFEPCRTVSDDFINIFQGLPLKVDLAMEKCDFPVDLIHILELYPKCANIVELLKHLCNYNDCIFEYLINWLAYPLQHIGTKMTQALVLNSDIHGSGKSLFFEEVIKPIYGQYATTLGQSDLESTYTGNRSGKLFVIFEEVFNNKQKYDNSGAMKHMITGKTMRIERKFVDSYEEANYINCAFLSNEHQPFKIEEHDRRYFVVSPEKSLGNALRDAVITELGNGGIDEFYNLLLSLPLTLNYDLELDENGQEISTFCMPKRFDAHTKPPLTQAKANVIAFGRYGWQTFYTQWQTGEIADIPWCSCLADDLWKLYHWWCVQNNEREMGRTKFMLHIASKMPRAYRWYRDSFGSTERGMIFNRPLDFPPNDETKMDYIGKQVLSFASAVSDKLGYVG